MRLDRERQAAAQAWAKACSAHSGVKELARFLMGPLMPHQLSERKIWLMVAALKRLEIERDRAQDRVRGSSPNLADHLLDFADGNASPGEVWTGLKNNAWVASNLVPSAMEVFCSTVAGWIDENDDPHSFVAAREAVLDIVGNPLAEHPPVRRTVGTAGLSSGKPYPVTVWEAPWLTCQVVDLALSAYLDRCNGRLDRVALAVLADAMEESGCQDGALLSHLRQSYVVRWRIGAGPEQVVGNFLSSEEAYRTCTHLANQAGWQSAEEEFAGFHIWVDAPCDHFVGCWALDRVLWFEECQ